MRQAAAHKTSEPAVSNRRHICIVSETYAPEVNGVALTLARFVQGLRGRGHTVSIVRPQQRDEHGVRSLYDARSALVRGLPLPGSHGLQFGVPAKRKLHNLWIRSRPDVVYVATEGPLGWSAVSAARRLGIPVLSGFHTNFDSYARHYQVGFLQPAVLRYLRAFHNRTDGTLVPSTDLRDRLDRLGFHNVCVLGRGVDTILFSPRRRSEEVRRRWGAGAHDTVALYVGRVADEKNVPTAIAAYRAMKAQHERVTCVIVGDGPLRATLQEEHPDIIFAGQRTGEELAQYYASADVFLFPSETETFGNVTLEALASGLAVVAYNYAAAGMHIVHRHTGMLAPTGDSHAFTTIAAELVRAPHVCAEIRQRAWTYATSVSWGRAVERFEMLLLGAEIRRLRVAQPSARYSGMMA